MWYRPDAACFGLRYWLHLELGVGLLHLHQEAGLQLVDVLCSVVCFVTKGLNGKVIAGDVQLGSNPHVVQVSGRKKGWLGSVERPIVPPLSGKGLSR